MQIAGGVFLHRPRAWLACTGATADDGVCGIGVSHCSFHGAPNLAVCRGKWHTSRGSGRRRETPARASESGAREVPWRALGYRQRACAGTRRTERANGRKYWRLCRAKTRPERVGQYSAVSSLGGAGIATAFNAPIAGAVFVLEELIRRFDTRIALRRSDPPAAPLPWPGFCSDGRRTSR